jgi:hypothetical protein
MAYGGYYSMWLTRLHARRHASILDPLSTQNKLVYVEISL